jgi:hypothetical protein
MVAHAHLHDRLVVIGESQSLDDPGSRVVCSGCQERKVLSCGNPYSLKKINCGNKDLSRFMA